ncbi:hypothetical protein NXW27_13070 [Phocaeicola dorei]|nr:hypothetical protein [Phocaeicola dorei]
MLKTIRCTISLLSQVTCRVSSVMTVPPHGRGIRVSLLRRDLSLFRRNTQADGGGGARILQDVDILVAGEKLVTPDMQGPIRITASIKRNGKIVIFRHAVT